MAESIRRVALTGAAGYIGSRLLHRLEREAAIEHILAIDVRPLSGQFSPRVEYRRHDVTVPMADLLAEHRIDAVVHLAFVLRPGRDRAAIRKVNVDGAHSLLDACAQAGVRHIVHLSSTTVYGAHPDNPVMLTEESPLRPVRGFQYGEDKVECEGVLADFLSRHPAVTASILRCCPVLGPSSDNFVSRAFSRPFLPAVRGYDPPMQFIHEDDVVEVLSMCLMQRLSGTYNLAGNGTVRWSEMAAMSGRRLVQVPARLLYGLTGLAWTLRLQSDSPPSGLDFIRHRWTASTEKIKRELGVTIQYSSKDAWQASIGRSLKPTEVSEARR